ncbi:hypothetical protein yinte0001_9730 [Yersinia intermedia ATCC 29909]|nr:hypothetical protein yinte0001_9730 [Yersinia intermedia ATCC 29909]
MLAAVAAPAITNTASSDMTDKNRRFNDLKIVLFIIFS